MLNIINVLRAYSARKTSNGLRPRVVFRYARLQSNPAAGGFVPHGVGERLPHAPDEHRGTSLRGSLHLTASLPLFNRSPAIARQPVAAERVSMKGGEEEKRVAGAAATEVWRSVAEKTISKPKRQISWEKWAFRLMPSVTLEGIVLHVMSGPEMGAPAVATRRVSRQII